MRIEVGAARRQVQQVHPHVEQRRSDQLDVVEGLREVARALELADQRRRRRAALRIDLVLAALGEAYRARDARLIFLKDDPSWQGLRLDGLPPGLTPV